MDKVFGLTLTQNQLKMLAAVTMLLDHIGVAIFPQVVFLRIIGRLSFPIFAYFIYQGCKYTSNKRLYLLRILGLGLICVFGYYQYEKIVYGNILITFSLSICIVYSLQFLKSTLVNKQKQLTIKLLVAIVISAVSTIFAVLLCELITIDYGFAGVMVPVITQLFDMFLLEKNENASLLGFTVGLIILTVCMGNIQFFCLFSLILISLCNGKRGVYKMKYFFYLFYPMHLIIIGVVASFK